MVAFSDCFREGLENFSLEKAVKSGIFLLLPVSFLCNIIGLLLLGFVGLLTSLLKAG